MLRNQTLVGTKLMLPIAESGTVEGQNELKLTDQPSRKGSLRIVPFVSPVMIRLPYRMR